jgi:hypothetical protein
MSSETSAPYKWNNLQQKDDEQKEEKEEKEEKEQNEEKEDEEEEEGSPRIKKRGIPKNSENSRHPYNRYHPNRHYSYKE